MSTVPTREHGFKLMAPRFRMILTLFYCYFPRLFSLRLGSISETILSRFGTWGGQTVTKITLQIDVEVGIEKFGFEDVRPRTNVPGWWPGGGKGGGKPSPLGDGGSEERKEGRTKRKKRKFEDRGRLYTP